MRRLAAPAAEQRYRFFGGKGGVGKTTCAAAAAIALAEARHSVLLVSLDPAHSLGDALGRALASRPTRVATRRGTLEVVELDADAALDRWIEKRRPALRSLLARGTYLDDDDIEQLLRLSLPGVDELIGLIELGRLAGARPYEQVVVDTAPTGHLLRLLGMPATLKRLAGVLDAMHAKHRFLGQALGGRYRPDASDAVIAEVDAQAESLAALLRDPARCQVTWIMLAEQMTLEEAKDGVTALGADGITVSDLVVNRVTRTWERGCSACARRVSYEQGVVAEARRLFRGIPIRIVPAQAEEPRGLASLRALGRHLTSVSAEKVPRRPSAPGGRSEPTRMGPAERDGGWLDALAPAGVRLLLFAGKGGVGKTSCAAAVAVALSARSPERRILLLSIDPAHSVGDVMAAPAGDTARAVGRGALEVRELDARSLLDLRRQRYLQAVDEAFGALRDASRLDPAFDRAVIEHLVDLAPPGIDELLGLLEVLALLRARAGGGAPYDTVVLDTAPTGHTLRLLAMPAAGLEWVHAFMALWLKYRKVIGLGDLAWDLVSLSRDLRDLQRLLGDPRQARAVVVTRPAELPRLETRRLLAGVRRLGLTLSGVIANTVTVGECRRCRRAERAERAAVAALRTELEALGVGERPVIEAPTVMPPPSGAAGLARWSRSWRRVA
ncbi:MAG TPA: ArsA family ATPase [Methylomirabilota bacterium]|jgi:arsenite-transporting ATPase|nr:ArsA family ATPase [Methylomirabilota bacterium]